MDDADALRQRVASLAKPGGQRAFARGIGTDQGSVSRYLAGGKLTAALAKGLRARHPELREAVDAVFWRAPDIQEANRDHASAAAS